MRFRLVLPLVPLVAACAATTPPPAPQPPPPSPSPRSAETVAPAAPSAALRYATKAPLPPTFTDPDRAKKLAELVPKLEKRVDEFFATQKPPSLAVAMVADGKVVFTRILGVRDRASKAPATERTMYRIGSITKTFTATTVLALRDAGLIRLDEPAETYLPELTHLEYPFHDVPRITVRHLLTHTSGMPRDIDLDVAKADHDMTEAEFLGTLERTSLARAPGTAYSYSNFGVSLLGPLVARRAPEKSFRAAVEKRVTEPLGMLHTTFDPKTIPDAEPATGYSKKADATPVAPWRLGASEGAGGLWSTAPDMARWVAAQLAAWPPRDEPEDGPIARASLREAHTPGVAFGLNAHVDGDHLSAEASSVGLAWHTHETCAYERLVEHGGAIDGFRASVGFAPERGFGFVVLASSLDTSPDELQAKLFEEAAPVLSPRQAHLAPDTTALVAKLASTIGTCDDAAYSELFASPFRAAIPLAQYKALCGEETKTHGACRPGPVLSLEGPYDGEVSLVCDRGEIRARINVGHEEGQARFRGLVVRSTGFAPSKEVLRASEAILGLYAKWDSAKFKALFANATIEPAIKAGFEKERAEIGACRLARDAEKVRDSDGGEGGVLPLACEKGAPTNLHVSVDPQGKVTGVYFRPRSSSKHRCTDPEKPKRESGAPRAR